MNAITTTKGDFQLSLYQNTKIITVKGYSFTLPTGHEAIVHKSINKIGWSVTLKDNSFLFVHMVGKKRVAINKAVEEALRLGKRGLDRKVKQFA